MFIISFGAVNSSSLLLRSRDQDHPNGLANSSGMVGQIFMKHQKGLIMGLSAKKYPRDFQKTLAVNDFYWGSNEYDHLLG